MSHHTCTHHVEIDTDNTFCKMLICFHRSGMVPIFPEISFSFLTLVKLLSSPSSNQLQALGNNILFSINNQKVDMLCGAPHNACAAFLHTTALNYSGVGLDFNFDDFRFFLPVEKICCSTFRTLWHFRKINGFPNMREIGSFGRPWPSVPGCWPRSRVSPDPSFCDSPSFLAEPVFSLFLPNPGLLN